jgi:DNA-binding NtrC family response regulator
MTNTTTTITAADQKRANILIIDDEPLVRDLLRELLAEQYDCTTVDSAEKALAVLQREIFDLVLSDINMGGMSGIEMIPHVLASAPDITVIMISGQQTIDSAIEAMRFGAFDYIKKPFVRAG